MVLTHGPMAHGEGAVNCSLYLPFFPLPIHLLMSLSVCLSCHSLSTHILWLSGSQRAGRGAVMV